MYKIRIPDTMYYFYWPKHAATIKSGYGSDNYKSIIDLQFASKDKLSIRDMRDDSVVKQNVLIKDALQDWLITFDAVKRKYVFNSPKKSKKLLQSF